MSTFHSIHLHVTFSTKYRMKWIHRSWEERLYEYLGGTLRGLNLAPQGIGGVEDHVHLLIGFKPSRAISDTMRELKKASSAWVHSDVGMKDFAWQEGYAVFSVSVTERSKVKGYIARQREHHRKRTFQEELMEMLDRAGVQYDPKYLT
ncbi:Transposase IS200 like protein [Stieleria neptunia]|uniref:Transposase IS200 like protein n=1 Tax=Stieleria neptunia TaxID=2527979 RepID=A0A518I209_9BACT|nr:IS200/IS605 family transposase [Stieleria neptunia]QDV47139.1 Transposase IS200 like protein [Stieleria neptunia]